MNDARDSVHRVVEMEVDLGAFEGSNRFGDPNFVQQDRPPWNFISTFSKPKGIQLPTLPFFVVAMDFPGASSGRRWNTHACV